MHIIPAIDIIDGKCVRLTQGDYSQKKIYNEDPLEVAKEFEDAGLTRLHLVDLDGAKAKKIVNWKVLERIAEQTSLHIDFGGGVRCEADLDLAFSAGAKQITGGSIAVHDRPEFMSWIMQYGSERIILGADAKKGMIAVNGWEEATSLEISEFIGLYMEEGIRYAICTDIDKDGMGEGPSFELYSRLKQDHPKLRLIASGGVSSINDLRQLKAQGLYGAIIGKAIYEGHISLRELADFVQEK